MRGIERADEGDPPADPPVAGTDAALHESEAWYRTLFETMGQGYCDLELLRDAEGRAVDQRYLEFNPAFERLFGIPISEAKGRKASEVFPELETWWHEAFDRIARRGEPERIEYQVGALGRWFEVFAYPRGGDRLAVLYEDVTERKRAENALRVSEARYRTLVENVLDYAIYLLDADGVITEWTPGAARVKGYAADEALGQHFRIFYPERDRAGGVPEHELAHAARDGRTENEGWRVRKDGTRFWADEILTPVYDRAGALIGFTKVCRDLTHRMLVDAAAERQRQDRVRDHFRRQLAAAEENERRRLARELHDQLGQHLAALALGLDEARRLVSDSPSGPGHLALRVAMRLKALQELTTAMTRDARTLALELRPPELDDAGLESAVETYVAAWTARTGIAADVEVTGMAGRPVARDTGTAVYRILQEALTNVVKHAGAEHVSVIIEKPDGEVRLIVEDDGRGFDIESARQRTRVERRLGLAGMRERAALVGGAMTVESAPGAGTTLYFVLPDAADEHPLDEAPATTTDEGTR